MSLPRRVPWATLSQLEQVYTAIYTTQSYEFAIKRLSAWKYACGLPHALDATLSLLVALESDKEETTCKLTVRQNYALALIRFVNGLVDPLQKGVYARSIAGIASQIGLPISFVELRHACTHEELPSLQILREGCRQALKWLEERYFFPTLEQAFSSTSDSVPSLEPLLRQYKTTMKPIIKDNSLQKIRADEIDSLLASFDAWISEAAITAWGIWDANMEERNAWALERLAVALTETGGLVPVAKKKQPNNLEVPNAALWLALLDHLKAEHPEFPAILMEALIAAVSIPSEEGRSTRDSGHSLCLCGWILYLSTHWGDSVGCDAEMTALSLLRTIPKDEAIAPHLQALFEGLGARYPHLQSIISSILQVVEIADVCASLGVSSNTKEPPQENHTTWTVDSLTLMEERLQQLQVTSKQAPVSEGQQSLMKGWRLLGKESGWNPCPIGS